MAQAAAVRTRSLPELFRFYQAAIVNTGFGFGTFALLIWLGTNLYVAQILAQILGVTFNYFTYTRHVFRDSRASKLRFLCAYGVNYLVNLALLALVHLTVRSPYVAGFVATIAASLINYFALKHLVFVGAKPAP